MGISWLPKVRNRAVFQRVEVETSSVWKPGDAGVLGQGKTGSGDDHLGNVRVEQERVSCLQLC